eukprot:UN24021
MRSAKIQSKLVIKLHKCLLSISKDHDSMEYLLKQIQNYSQDFYDEEGGQDSFMNIQKTIGKIRNLYNNVLSDVQKKYLEDTLKEATKFLSTSIKNQIASSHKVQRGLKANKIGVSCYPPPLLFTC